MPNREARAKHIAEAFVHIARVNHYMVGFINVSSKADELEMARQILIATQNEKYQTNIEFDISERAIDLIEVEIKGAKL